MGSCKELHPSCQDAAQKQTRPLQNHHSALAGTTFLHRHPNLSAAPCRGRLHRRVTILKDYVRTVRRVRAPAFLTLAFAPGECAQVDWGCAGSMAVGSTRRRLSFFVMVLCYSRLCYLEFSLGEATEHFLSAHQNAFEFIGGVPFKVLIDFVPRNKIDVMCLATLCCLAWAAALFAGWST